MLDMYTHQKLEHGFPTENYSQSPVRSNWQEDIFFRSAGIEMPLNIAAFRNKKSAKANVNFEANNQSYTNIVPTLIKT